MKRLALSDGSDGTVEGAPARVRYDLEDPSSVGKRA